MAARSIFHILLLIVVSPCAYGQTFYRFSEIETIGGFTPLAIVELSTLPASHSNIIGLEFTPAGEVRFGLDQTYASSFDFTNNPLADDGTGGLTGSGGNVGEIVDLTPSNSSLHPTSGTASVAIQANTIGPDLIVISPVDTRVDPTIIVNGEWRVIPEPTTAVLALAGLWLAAVRRRR